MNRALVLTLGLPALGLLALTLETGAASAQEWTFESALSQKGGYNSNILLKPDHEISTFSSQTTPEFTLTRTSPTSEVSLNGRFEFNAYIDHSELNSADQLVKLTGTKALSERSSVQFLGNFRRDTTLESEEDATGRFVDDGIRFIRWDVNPSWQYLLSPIDRLTLSATYLQVDYDSNEKTDYRDYGPTITYAHDLSELASITASLNYSRFEPDENRNSADFDDDGRSRSQDTYGGLLGYDYHPTERFTIGGAAGLNYNVTHEDSGDSGSISYRFQFNVNYDINDQTEAKLVLSRDTEPTGEGRERTRNRGTLGFAYKMTEMTSFTLDTSYIQDQKTASNSGVSEYLAVRPGVRWDITEDLSLAANYQFRYKTFTENGSATDNGAFITLRYALPDQNWSGF